MLHFPYTHFGILLDAVSAKAVFLLVHLGKSEHIHPMIYLLTGWPSMSSRVVGM